LGAKSTFEFEILTRYVWRLTFITKLTMTRNLPAPTPGRGKNKNDMRPLYKKKVALGAANRVK
jgi:hypothetical protein